MKEYVKTFLLAILAGLCIGLGGNVFLALASTSRLLGAFLFTVGLFTICIFGFALFTGRVCSLFDNPPKYIVTLIVIWIGNFLGAWAMGAIVRLTRLGAAFTETALGMCEAKLSDSFLSLFLLGFVCNLFLILHREERQFLLNKIGGKLGRLAERRGFRRSGRHRLLESVSERRTCLTGPVRREQRAGDRRGRRL